MFKSLIAATAAVGFAALMPAATGRSRSWIRGRRRSRRVGTILGSALAPREVYVVPPPPPPPPGVGHC